MAKTKRTRVNKARPGNSVRNSRRASVLRTYKVYINGKFPRTESGRSYEVAQTDDAAPIRACRCSKKDFRESVNAARSAFTGWSTAGAYLRGQIIYRIAEMLEGRREQFISELCANGTTQRRAATEMDAALDLLVNYAGWADKFQQVFSSVNPVNSSHFNFSVCEPTGVVSIIAPHNDGLFGLVANLAPVIVGGNTSVVLASESQPLCAVTLAEVLHSSDVPAGVVNILTGLEDELVSHFASHMDVNAVVYCGDDPSRIKLIQLEAARNVKRVVIRPNSQARQQPNPYFILDTQEIKTTWHPIGC